MDFSAFLFGWLPYLLLVVLSLLSFSIFNQKTMSIRPKLPPSPPGLPILGNLHQLGEVTHHSLWRLSKKYGPLMYLKLGKVPTIVASSARMAREVLKIHDKECCSRPAFISWVTYSYDLLDIAFSPYNEHWKEMRKICFHEILNAKRVQSYRYIREEEVEKMVESISLSCGHSSEPINMSAAILSFFYHVICRVLFSRSYQGGNETEKAKIHGIIDEGRNLMGGFFVADYFPHMWWLDAVTGVHRRLRRNFLEYDSLYERIIEDHLDPKRPKPEEEDFLDVLLQLQKDSDLSRDNIKAILMVCVSSKFISCISSLLCSSLFCHGAI